MDKSKFLDAIGRPLTQSLFLELGYDTRYAVYTLKDFDFEYEGKIYPSIKQKYVAMGDITEYNFANTYFLNWDQWQKICANRQCQAEIEQWRAELEQKLKAESFNQMLTLAQNGNYQASKWLADRGWDVKGAGRPSKAEKEGHLNKIKAEREDYSADVIRLMPKVG